MNQVSNINEIEIKINYLKQQTAENIIEIGNQLNAAKEIVPHGEWGGWLKEKCDFSTRTAQRFMKTAEEFPNATALSYLGQSKVFKLLELPKEEREEFIVDHDVESMSTRELNKEIKNLKKRNKELENTKPKVITEKVIEKVEERVEVVPEDYADLKEWFQKSVSKDHYDNTVKSHDEAKEQIKALEKQIEELGSDAVVEEHYKKLKTSILTFSMKTRNFIEEVGGFVFLMDFQEDLDPVDKKIFFETVNLIYGYAFNLHHNLKEE